MKPISAMPVFWLGLLDCWQLFLFWGSMWILIVGFREKRRMNLALRNALLIGLSLFIFGMLQLTIGFTAQNMQYPISLSLVEHYAGLPFFVPMGICILLTAAEAALLRRIRRWYNTHITAASIKEVIETLPVGICAYEPSGKVTLKNKTMEQLCRSLTGHALLNGNEFRLALREGKASLASSALELPDLGVWSFTEDRLQDRSNCFSLLVAYNVTEEYQKTQMLAQKRQTVQALNVRLTEYNRRIESVITAQEILRAKIRIHDELGAGLLAIRRYLVSGGTEEERTEILDQLGENIRFLQQKSAPQVQDEYSLMLSTAEALGVRVHIRGTLPEAEPGKHILATAIHECFTNILRHTDGDTLFINIAQEEQTIAAEFTDNGSLPVETVSEKGGLCSLRALTEQIGGTMRITAGPRFQLTITLPKEAQEYGLSGFNRG